MTNETFRARVKPLVWKRFRTNGFKSTTLVVSPSKQWVSNYSVGDSLSGRTRDWFYWFDGKTERRAKTKEIAMAICQRDHNARVLALLEIEEER